MRNGTLAEQLFLGSWSRRNNHSKTWRILCTSFRTLHTHLRESIFTIANIHLSRFSKSKDLNKLSSLGHFLKGSSATLGLVKVQDYCEKIQNLGSGLDKTGTTSVDDREESLAGITSVLGEMKEEYKCVCVRFRKFYDDLNGDSQL